MNEITPVENTGSLALQNQTGLQPLPLEQIDLIHHAETLPFDLMSDYWSPTQVGEIRNVLFDRIQDMDVPDPKTGEVIELPCAFFFWQEKEGMPIKSIRNGSKKLVGALQAWNLPRLAPLEIRYVGKVKNSTNSNYSDSWSIKPKRINVTSEQ